MNDDDSVRREIDALRRARADLPGRMQRIAAVAAASARFLDPADPLRVETRDALAASQALAPAMVDEILRRAFAPITVDALAEFSEGDAHALVAIVSAGNVAGVFLPKTALALAAGSACLLKSASEERILAPAFARAVADCDPRVGAVLAARWWPGGSGPWQRALETQVDSLIAYGSDASMAAIRRACQAPLVEHGSRWSLAIVDLSSERHPVEVALAAQFLAREASLHEQRGCLSPQGAIVIGDETAHRFFGEALAAAMPKWVAAWPPAVSEAVAVDRRRAVDEVEWRSIAGEAMSQRSGEGWTVVEDAEGPLAPGPLGRTLRLWRCASAEVLPARIDPVRSEVESVGLWPFPNPAAEAALGGIPRVVAIAEMQSPTLAWRQGGADPSAGIYRRREA